MNNIKRAIRRNQKASKRNKAEKLVKEVWKEKTPDVVEMMVRNCDNLKMCNKDCCKNPRRSGWSKSKGKTRKELRDETKNEE